MKSYKIYIDSAAWVCEVNLVGTSRIYRYIIVNNHEITKNPSEADYIIINSCGLTKDHIKRCVNLFEDYYSQKKEGAEIIMFGCLVKINPELIDSLDLYSIDFNKGEKFDNIFYKNTKFEDVKPYCDNKTKQGLLQEIDPFHRTKIFPFFLSGFVFPFFKRVRLNYRKMIDNVSYKNRIFIEISKGCTGNCSYCVIKKARGNICSRIIKDILSDIGRINDPSKKVFLVANDCGSYGLDIKTTLINLLYEINKGFPDLLIELNYLHPFWLERYSNEYIKLFKDVKINFATIPIQSGSNKILKKMNRKYDINKVIKVVDKIKLVSPKTFIYTHLIVGFPGENTIDFLKTLKCALHFDFPIAFEYSEHEDTVSSSLPHHKSYFTITSRYVLFLIFMNFFVFYKLLSNPKDKE